jgi:hypothetical protein
METAIAPWRGDRKGSMNRPLSDTDESVVRVGSRRQLRGRCKVDNQTIPGFFVKKWLPVGGGVTTTVVAFFVSSNSEDFPNGLERLPKSRGRKNPPLEKSQAGEVRQG